MSQVDFVLIHNRHNLIFDKVVRVTLSTKFYCKLNLTLLRLRDSAMDLLPSKEKRRTNPEKFEKAGETRTVRLIEPDPGPQDNTETHLKKIEALEKMLEEKEGKIKIYQTNTQEDMKTILNLKRNLTEEADKLKNTVSDLEDAKKEIETVTAENSELVLILQNCEEAAEGKKELEALLEKSREEAEEQITKLEKKNEATLKQLKFQGRIHLYQMMIFSNFALCRGADKNVEHNKTGEKPTM